MSFSSRRRNYLLTPHRRDGLIEWMKSMLQHSFVLDALETTGADTFSHFELLIDEHCRMEQQQQQQHQNQLAQNSNYVQQPSRLRQLVPTIGTFHTRLPLRAAFEVYNAKHRLTKRKHIQISFNEIRHILNLAQIMAFCPDSTYYVNKGLLTPEGNISARSSRCNSDVNLKEHAAGSSSVSASSPKPPPEQPIPALNKVDLVSTTASPEESGFDGPRLISFDGDQTLYSDGANFESNPELAHYLYLLLKSGVTVAVVTAAGYEYNVEKYEYRLSGLLQSFKQAELTAAECERFYLFGGECNYLLQLNSDYRLRPVREYGPGGWCTSTQYLSEAPANWKPGTIKELLDVVQENVEHVANELQLRARIVRKKRAVGLIPVSGQEKIPRESLDETVLRVHEKLHRMNGGRGPGLPYCAFNGGSDCWIDVGNKRVGVQILQSYTGTSAAQTLHIGDQFLNTGNDYAARDVSPCVWIISPQETTYILKSILRLAGVENVDAEAGRANKKGSSEDSSGAQSTTPSLASPENDASAGEGDNPSGINFSEMERRRQSVKAMDVYTGDVLKS